MKKQLIFFLMLYPTIIICQQGKNIDLKEVVNTAAVIPRINIDGLIYSIRDRDQIITNLLRSPFWDENYKFTINLEDYDSGRKYTYQNKGVVRVFVNNIELSRRHNFKAYDNIKLLLKNAEDISVISSAESQRESNLKYQRNSSYLSLEMGPDELNRQGAFLDEKKKVPVTLIKIKSDLSTEVVYNKAKKRSKLKKLSELKVIDKSVEVGVKGQEGSRRLILRAGTTVYTDQITTVELEGVDVVKNVEDNGIIYSPELVNGQIIFKKNQKLTRLKKQSDKFLKMGLNEWGIDVDANTWSQALRGYLRGKQTFITSDGLPILFGAVTLGDEQPGPLWVVDGVYLTQPPGNVRSLAPLIREVNVLKYNATKYGSRGAAGVIEINTSVGLSEDLGNYKKSFAIKGKENIRLMEEFQKYEKQFILEREKLNDSRKIFIQSNEVEKVDSIQELINSLTLKSYLFTANFAINNADYEVAPYLALNKIGDAKLKILEAIEQKLSPQIRKSKYGKRFIEFLEIKKSRDTTSTKN